jgi:hypothetical protein
MKRNVGRADRGLRLIIGLVVLITGYFYESYWGLLGLVPLVSGGMGWCPLYAILGMNSCRTEKAMS